jgi:hypothetical protein
VLLIYENCCAEPPCKKGGAGHGLLMMPALLRLFMQVYISWAWAFSLPPFGVMRKNALQRWSRAVAAWFLRRLAFLLLFFFFSRPPLLPAFPMFIMSSCASAISGNISGDKLGTPLAGCSCCLISVFRPLVSPLCWSEEEERKGKGTRNFSGFFAVEDSPVGYRLSAGSGR